jgi:hypothetical protein
MTAPGHQKIRQWRAKLLQMNPSSVINSVHVAHLSEAEYGSVAAYLREPQPTGRRSYMSYIGSVFELDDTAHSVVFQDESLLPKDDRGRPRILLLFSNAHPTSIKNGMFHTAESGVADLWNDLRAAGLFPADRGTLGSPDALRDWCLGVKYDGRFCLGFVCYWIFPSFLPKHLRQLFGPTNEPPGFRDTEARFANLVARWRPAAIISFNGDVFARVTATPRHGYIDRVRQGVVEAIWRLGAMTCPIFQTYPAAWRYVAGADQLRRESLRRISDRL